MVFIIRGIYDNTDNFTNKVHALPLLDVTFLPYMQISDTSRLNAYLNKNPKCCCRNTTKTFFGCPWKYWLFNTLSSFPVIQHVLESLSWWILTWHSNKKYNNRTRNTKLVNPIIKTINNNKKTMQMWSV